MAASPKAVDRRRSTTPCYHSQIRPWPRTQIHSRRPGGHITYTTSPQLYTSTAESTSQIPLYSDIPQPPSSPVSPVQNNNLWILPPPVVHLQTVYTYYYHLPHLLHLPTLLPYYFACSESTCKPNLNHSPLDPQPDTVWNTTLLPYYFVEHYPTSLLLCRTIPCSLLLCLAA